MRGAMNRRQARGRINERERLRGLVTVALMQKDHARAELARLLGELTGTSTPEVPLQRFEDAVREHMAAEGRLERYA